VGDTGGATVGAVLQLGLLLPLQKEASASLPNRVSFVLTLPAFLH